MFVKFCGIQSGREAAEAVAAGASAIGLLAGLTHRAGDGVTPDVARGIAAGVPAPVRAVLVTHLVEVGALAALARAVGVAAVQLQGEVPPEDLARLRDLLPGAWLVKAVHVTGPEALAHAARYAAVADALVLDSRTTDRLGGTGQTHDWEVSRRIVAAMAPLPVFLAGGLRPENVARAIRQVRPAGVDVNSGVEDGAGAKDPERLRRFVAEARGSAA